MAKKTFKDPFASIRATQEKELKKLQEQAKKPKANPPMDFTGNIYQRKGVSAVLPETVAPSPWKRLPSAGGIGLLKGTMDLADKINTLNYAPTGGQVDVEGFKKKGISLNEPTLQPNKPAGVYSKQVNTLPYTDTHIEGLKKKAGLQGTLAEEIFYGIGHETPAIIASYGTVGTATKIPAIGKALTGAGKWTETGRRGVAAGALYTPIAEENPKIKDYLENMALFGLGDVAFTGAFHGIGKGIKTLKGKPAKPPATEERSGSLDYLLGEGSTPETRPDYAPWVREDLIGDFNQQRATELPRILTREQDPWAGMRNTEYSQPWPDYIPPQGIVPDFTGTPYGVYRGSPRAELPGIPERLALPSGERLALPGQEMKALPPGQDFAFSEGYPIEGHWFVDPYGVARGEPGTPLALPEGKPGQGGRFIRQDEGQIPRSDIGDPAYLAGLEKQYNDIVSAEVASMKSELGGVETIGQNPYEMQPGQMLFDGYKRVSQNPAWYREFWQKHLRPPREGEWRDLAIKNLMEGNPETGEPANAEFLAIMSELSRGQRLPEEWHGIQRTIRDLEGSKGEYVPEESTGELDSLLADMRAERAKVEPFGLTRDMGRLNEAENVYRGRMEDKADFGRYEKVRFKRDDVETGVGKESPNYTKAIREFGTTNDFNEAGYLTPNGKLLDFSGKRQGGPRGTRSMDHREIYSIYDENFDSYSDAMIEFMNEGNIRMQSYGFEISSPPTREQERALTSFINKNKGEVVVDLNKVGNAAGTPIGVEYPEGTKASKIISDIRRFYENGEEPQISDISRFRYKRGKEYAPTFYSQLQRVIEQKMPNRATPEQIKGILSKGAVKEEELKWADLDGFLEGKQKVTKQEVLDYLKQNDVQIEEVTPSGNRYESYTLPGGENYRELLLTMPGKIETQRTNIEKRIAEIRLEREAINAESLKGIPKDEPFDPYKLLMAGTEPQNKPLMERDNLLRNELVQLQEKLSDMSSRKDSVYQSAHWQEPNVLAHVRFNDRTGANGEKVLHIEEVQSDWGQDLRRGKDVPDMPFAKSWPEFVMKRMIRYAAENGYDRISWTTGEQQAARYDLSKQVDAIRYGLESDGKYSIMPTKDGYSATPLQRVTAEDLPSVVGKELAEKIVKGEGSPLNSTVFSHELSGVDLQMGGAGMKGFYDRMIPSWLNKYAKKWGAKVEAYRIGGDGRSYNYKKTTNGTGKYEIFDTSTGQSVDWVATEQEAKDYVNRLSNEKIVHSLPVTKAMRDSVLYEGQPKFKYADSTAKKAVGEANQTLGLTRGDKDRITYAADGWTPEMELADKAANALSGTGVIPVKMPSFMDKFQGFFEATNRKIFVNKNTKDPITYVAYHETGHRMKETHPEHYARIEEIALNNLKEEHSGLIERYSKRGYATDEMPEEFTSDLIAEMLHDKSFIGKLREQAPEVIKPLLDILDEVITKVKLALGKDDSVLPYIENLEKLRNELSPEYASYLETVQGERMAAAKYREGWGKAAKVKGERTDIGTDYVLDRVEYDADYDLYPGYGRDAIPDAEYRFESKQEAEQYARDVLDIFESLPEKVKVYRAIRTENPQTIDLEGLGESWSFDKDSAIEFGSHNGSNFLIESEVAKKDIDLQGSIDAFVHNSEVFGDISSENEIVIPYGTKLAEATVYQLGKSGVRENPILRATNVRAKFNRGTFDPTNPDIRFKLGEGGKSPVDDLKAMVEYGAGQLHKGNYSHFIKLMEKQFPDELSGYNPEITERLMKDVYLRAKELRDTGQTQLEFPGQVVTVRRGEQGRTLKPREKEVPATEPTASTQRIAEIDKELEALGWRIKGTEKSTTKYPTDEARSAHISELQARANELTQERNLLTSEGQHTYNDISGFQAETQDVARNFRDFYGRDVELEEGSILDEMNTAKSSNIDYQEYWVNKLKTEVVDRLGIDKNSPLSKLVQQYGEGEITLEQLRLKRPKDWEKVVEADGWFREAYDTVLDDVNRVIEQIYPGQPDRLVPKRKDYYRHFRDLEGFQGLQGMMGSPANISPELAGRSEFVKPKTKWASFKQQRGLGEFKRDAVGGFLEYLPAASYSINIDPMIGRFRGLSDQLAAETSGEANTMIRYLQDYANNLAGKTSGWDRKLQEVLELKGGNRVIMNTIMWLNNRAKQNAILLNPGSALSQLLNMPNVLGMGKQHVVPGIGKALLSIFKEDTARASSAFMKERFSGAMYRQFDTRMIDQPKRFAVWLIEVSDRLGTEMIWQTCHSKGLHTKGVANPVKYADAMTKRLVAGRGIGEMALIQQSKIFNVIAPFQVEVGNLWKVQKDLMKEKDFAGLVLLYAGLWLANSAMEEVRGMRVAFDPIDALINAGKEIADPKNEPKEKAVKAVGRLAGEVLGNIPVGQTMAAAYPEYGIKEWGLPTRKEFFGRDDPTRFGTGPLVVKAVQDPAKYLVTPFGGAQIDKTWKAAKALYNEGSYKNDDETGIDRYIPNITASGNMRYPVEVNAENTVKGLLFGPSAMDETKEFYENDRRPLGEKDTRRVEQAANPQAKYQDIMRKKKIDSIREKIRDVRKDKKLTPEQKRRKVNVLEAELRKVRQAQ